MCRPTGVHLIGSVALPDDDSVFRLLSRELGPWLKRLPDGETGERGRWIYWQREMLLAHPDFELATDIPEMELYEWNGRLLRRTQYVRFRENVDRARVKLQTGYAPAALASYETFKRLRDEGAISPGVKFQVCLPTAMSSAYQFVAPELLADYIAIYEAALLDDLKIIVDGVPRVDLSIQWDICQEVLVWEGYKPYGHRPSDYKRQITDELARIGNAVPAGVDMGYHLCYGSPADAHLVMPKDTGVMAEMVNGFVPGLSHSMDFLHLPVPQDRDDEAYFEPMKGMRIPAATELYLGLLHHNDGPGDKARIATAARVLDRPFGVATECGWGRTDPSRVPGLVAAHRNAMGSIGA